jgi:hypothetical protein
MPPGRTVSQRSGRYGRCANIRRKLTRIVSCGTRTMSSGRMERTYLVIVIYRAPQGGGLRLARSPVTHDTLIRDTQAAADTIGRMTPDAQRAPGGTAAHQDRTAQVRVASRGTSEAQGGVTPAMSKPVW